MSLLSAWLLEQWLRRGWVSWLLWPLQTVYAFSMATRRKLYQRGYLASRKLKVPVVIVGNRVAGGAGKTPAVIALVKHLQRAGWTPGVLSRGYGRSIPNSHLELIVDANNAATLNAVIVGDEPWLIWKHTQAPLAIGRNRFCMGQRLLDQHPQINILIGDDGLQHWALCRDIEIVLFDERGAGNGWLLPAGPLREPIDAPLGPACLQPSLVLYNAKKPSTHLPGFMAKRTLQVPQPLATWWKKQAPLDQKRPQIPLLSPQQCWAVAGIAQPQRFFDGLRNMGLNFTPCPRPDHDLLQPLPWPMGVPHIIITEKDAIKLTPDRLAAERPGCQVWVVPLNFQPETAFWLALNKQLAHLTYDVRHPPVKEIAHGHPTD